MKRSEAMSWPDRGKRLLLALGYSLLELLAAAPLLLGVAAFVYKGSPGAWWWLAGLAGYSLLAALAASVPFLRWTGLQLISNAVLIAAWGWLLYGFAIPAIPATLAGMILAWRAVQLVRYGDQARLHASMLWLGLTSCAPVGFVIHRAEGMGSYSPGLNLLAAALFVAALIVSNSASLSSGAYGGRSTTASGRSMRRFNRMLIVIFALPVAVVSFWGLVDRAVRQAARWLLGLLAALLSGSGEEAPPQPTAPPQAQDQPMLPMEQGEASIIWKILEYVMMAGMAVLSVIALYFALRSLGRRLPGWLRAAYAWLTRYRHNEGEQETGYIDVVTSTRSGKSAERPGPWKRLRRIFEGDSGDRWENLKTNRERVRFLYSRAVRLSIRSGLDWKAQWTPRETAREAEKREEAAKALTSGLCRAYEEARYGGGEPDDATVLRLREELLRK